MLNMAAFKSTVYEKIFSVSVLQIPHTATTAFLAAVVPVVNNDDEDYNDNDDDNEGNNETG